MEESEREQNGFERFLDFHLYMTSALRKTDMKAIGLQMALDLIHKKENRDLITGLKTRTQTGRPDWEKVSIILLLHCIPYCSTFVIGYHSLLSRYLIT